MILSYNDNDEPDGGWEGVARRYLLWLRTSRQNALNASVISHDSDTWSPWDKHIEEMRLLVKNTKTSGTELHFGMI